MVALAFATMKYIAATVWNDSAKANNQNRRNDIRVFSIVNSVNRNLLDPKASALNVTKITNILTQHS